MSVSVCVNLQTNTSSQGAGPSKPRQEATNATKNLLDAELDIYQKRIAGEDTAALQTRLEALKRQVGPKATETCLLYMRVRRAEQELRCFRLRN